MASTLKRLRDRCKEIERHVVWRRLASDDELRDYRPGGKQNPERRTLWGWIRWHSLLVAWLQRETRAPEKETQPRDAQVAWQRADEAILDILRAKPAVLALTRAVDGYADLAIHPKSFEALLECHARQLAIMFLQDRRAALLEHSANPGDLELVARAADEIIYHTQVCAWIAAHPGVRLPFPSGEFKPDLPDWVQALDPVDVARILNTYATVNALRLNYLDEILKPDGEAKRISWSVFMGTMSHHLHRPASELFRDVSLAELLATAAAAAVPHQEAAEELKRQREDLKRDMAGAAH